MPPTARVSPGWLRELRAGTDGRAVALDTVLGALVDGLAGEVGAERATLFLVDHARGALRSVVGHLPELARIELRAGEGLVGEVARTGRPVVVPDVADDRRFADRVDSVTGYRTRSVCAVAVRGEDGVLAVLEALNKRGGPFTPADVATMERLAEEVGEVLRATSLPGQLAQGATQAPTWRYNHILGDSPAMREAYDRVFRAAATEATVLVRGETGSGKELVARAVHDNSARRDGPFVKVDCAALPDTLVENELFGHERGAYTGADRPEEGKVAVAKGGTLFLDEVGELPLPAQGRLLRLLQDRVYFRVGGVREQRADVRFVAATNQPLEERVRAGTFREDLYYRLRVVEIRLPPLRERGEADLDRLVDHFLYRFTRAHRRPGLRLADAARARLHAHPWPGNVRELEHVIEAAVVLAPGALIGPADLSLAPTTAPEGGGFHTTLRPLAEVERDYAAWVIAQCGGNRTEAARRLGIGRNTLARMGKG